MTSELMKRAMRDYGGKDRFMYDRPPIALSHMRCCGIVEASSEEFEYYSKEDFLLWLKKFAWKREGIQLFSDGRWRAGMLLATSVAEDQREYVKWLKKVGFKVLRRFKNFNTGRNVTLWGYRLV